MNSRSTNSLVFLMITGFAISLHWNYLFDFPQNVHAWAQSDYLAITWQYLQNGFDFFHPATYHFNHQFPQNYEHPESTTITSADFPIHGFIIALLMKVFMNDSPGVYRIYVLMYSVLGLFFLFRFSREIGNDVFKSIFVLLLASTSPVFFYYQAGFLPSIINTSNVFISLYFFARYVKSGKLIYFIWTLIFLSLAGLNRTSFTVPLIALLCYEVYVSFTKKSWQFYKCLGMAISLTFILSYFYYNVHLRNTYGSIFLNEPMPPLSLSHAIELISEIIEMWSEQYFMSYVFYLFLLIPLIPTLSFWSKRIQITPFKKDLLTYMTIYFIGVLIFSILMLRQFLNHDYYFLDTLFVPLIIGVAVSLSLLPVPSFRFSFIAYSIIIIALAIPLITHGLEIRALRNEVACPSKIALSNQNFIGADQLLDELNISREAKLLVLDVETPNIPLMRMKRQGYVAMSRKKNVLEDMLSWPYDYVIVQNSQFISQSHVILPQLKGHLNRIGGNGYLSVCRYSNESFNQTLNQLLGLDKWSYSERTFTDFEGDMDANWTGFYLSNEEFKSGNTSCKMSSDDKYGLGTYFSLDEQKPVSRGIIVSGWALKRANKDFHFNVTVLDNDDWLFCNSIDLNSQIPNENEWHEFKAYFNLPSFDRSTYSVKTFIFNTGKNEVFFEDLEIKLIDFED